METATKRKEFEKQAIPHTEALLRSAIRMTKNKDDADDLVQETFIRAYRFWDKFEQGSNCRAWLFRIMTNMFINSYRSKARSSESVSVDQLDDNFIYGRLSLKKTAVDPEKEYFSRILGDEVKKAIDALPDDFRLVIVLSFLEEFSYQEISDILGLQLGTVKSRLHRGRKALQSKLFDYAHANGYIQNKEKYTEIMPLASKLALSF